MSTSDISTRTVEEYLDNCFCHVIIIDRHNHLCEDMHRARLNTGDQFRG